MSHADNLQDNQAEEDVTSKLTFEQVLGRLVSLPNGEKKNTITKHDLRRTLGKLLGEVQAYGRRLESDDLFEETLLKMQRVCWRARIKLGPATEDEHLQELTDRKLTRFAAEINVIPKYVSLAGLEMSENKIPKGKARASGQEKTLPRPNRPDDAAEEPVFSTKRPKRHASIYDAVAGRVGLNGFLSPAPETSHNDTLFPSTTTKPLAPHEVLLRRTRAPTKVPLDFYAADANLSADQRLPDSDLLKAIHAYASDFFFMATHDRGKYDFRSLDETALLAMGILLEEAAAEVLGETGDMVLVEPEGLENTRPEERMTRHQVRGRVRNIATPELEAESDEEIEDAGGSNSEEGNGRKRKRRRYMQQSR